MADRAAAKAWGEKFRALAADPTAANKQRAQELYEANFCHVTTFSDGTHHAGSHNVLDFHVGEMYCADALLLLDIQRHPNDDYLRVRGAFRVMGDPRQQAHVDPRHVAY